MLVKFGGLTFHHLFFYCRVGFEIVRQTSEGDIWFWFGFLKKPNQN
jgi:hypothetical protein